MQTRMARCALSLLVALGCGDRYPPEQPAAADERERAARRVADAAVSGPGYPDLEGKVFNYTYDDFAGFRVLIERNRLKFQGVSGEFEGITQLQPPQFSKIADEVYFMSWPVLGDMGDNVVLHLGTMRVFAHLGDGTEYRQIRGDIHCVGSSDECELPQGRIQSPLESIARLTLRKLGSNEPDESATPGGPTAAAEALEGMELTYRFADEPEVSLRVAHHEALVDEGDGPEPRGGAFTQPDERLFFISWNDAHGGQHIVFDPETMEVHRHIGPDGRRRAQVGRAQYFGPARGSH